MKRLVVFSMNALLGLIILHCFILHRWRGTQGLRAWFEETQRVLRCLEARQYALDTEVLTPLMTLFSAQLRTGRLQPQAIRTLLTWIRTLDRADAERRRVGYGAALRLGLAAGLGLLASLILDGTWFLRLADNPPAMLLIIGDSLILSLWLQRLKAHPLADSTELRVQFTRAFLGQSQGGPWHETWIKIHERGQIMGRDGHDEQIQVLEDWLLSGIQDQEKRLTWADELFGLVELAGSVYFLGTACALPLLKLWGG
ncbi:MAG TPA: hypothetical protein VE954_20805 [Oligoflexus sp.]|uniref:hypothetical protein n=1 Tax=Oligoflexus sp. TaxID=1971216 RepID=UPI002D24DFA9|nr:hypothetical protein [Oligoflexus sp.]HYX35544.1 hypothetical protein [Oligoflexus sp.]